MHCKQLSLKEIQEVSLKVMIEVHSFCIKNNIKYSLGYGSLLGAIRHKGFIPWDDDIDIVMTRPEYEKFCSTYQSENTLLIKPSNESYLNYARVCDIKYTTSNSQTPWTTRRDVGMWIDIFPLDAVEDDQMLFSQKMKELNELQNVLVHERSLLAKPSLHFPLKYNLMLMYSKIRNKKGNIYNVIKKIDDITRQFSFGETSHCSQLVCRGNDDKEFFDNSLFDDYHLVGFESTELMIANGWEDILRLNFGDYMQLPPLSERKPHGGFVKFYWK